MKTKPWYLSKGVMGSLAAMIAGVAGIWFTGITAEHLEPVLASAGSLVGGVLSLIGRIKANSTITK